MFVCSVVARAPADGYRSDARKTHMVCMRLIIIDYVIVLTNEQTYVLVRLNTIMMWGALRAGVAGERK